MNYEYTTDGPITVEGNLRNVDLHIVTGSEDKVLVEVHDPSQTSHRADSTAANGNEHGYGPLHEDSAEADVSVSFAGRVLSLEVPEGKRMGFGPGVKARAKFNIFGMTFSYDSGNDLTIKVTLPADSSADVQSASGDFNAQGRLHTVQYKSGSGDFTAENLSDANISTGSGDIKINSTDHGNLRTGSGDVSIKQATDLKAATGSGDISIESANGLKASSGSGDVSVTEIRGEVTLNSASGDVSAATAIEGCFRTKSSTGDVKIGVPYGTAVYLDCQSTTGDTRSELDDAEGPGDAERTLEIYSRSVTGDVVISRAAERVS